MDLIADILLASGAIGAGVYCFILGRRLNRFNDLEKGLVAQLLCCRRKLMI